MTLPAEPVMITVNGQKAELSVGAAKMIAAELFALSGIYGVPPLRVSRPGLHPFVHFPNTASDQVVAGEIVAVTDGNLTTATPPSFTVRPLGWREYTTNADSFGDPAYKQWRKLSKARTGQANGNIGDDFQAFPCPAMYEFVTTPADGSAFDYTASSYAGRKPLSHYYRVGQRVTIAWLTDKNLPVVIDTPEYGVTWIWIQLTGGSGATFTWKEAIKKADGTWVLGTIAGATAKELNATEGFKSSATVDEGSIFQAWRRDRVSLDFDDPDKPMLFAGYQLTVEEEDGSPSVTKVRKIIFATGTIVEEPSAGIAKVTPPGGGGSGGGMNVYEKLFTVGTTGRGPHLVSGNDHRGKHVAARTTYYPHTNSGGTANPGYPDPAVADFTKFQVFDTVTLDPNGGSGGALQFASVDVGPGFDHPEFPLVGDGYTVGTGLFELETTFGAVLGFFDTAGKFWIYFQYSNPAGGSAGDVLKLVMQWWVKT